MSKISKPKYMKIFDIQRMLEYLLINGKRPHYIQYNPSPKNVVIIYVDNAITSEDCQYKRVAPREKRDQEQLTPNEFETALENHEYHRVYINENIPTIEVCRNILKTTTISRASLALITPKNVNLVGTQDILHLFSYSRFVQSQTTFDVSEFDTFLKPKVKSLYFLVALDCEMMICKTGKQVGRVSMLDHTGSVIYHTFVKPASPVVDYLEQYSGLNAKNTRDGVSLERLRSDLLGIIGTDTYVLGHGIENDLEALNLYTENVIDTSYLYLNTDGYKVKLCELSRRHFGKSIQKTAHCPTEDAMCCLKLLAYKIAQLKNFYDPQGSVMKLGMALETVESLKDVPERKGLFMCKVSNIDFDELKRREDMFCIIFYNVNGKGHLAFRQKRNQG